MARSPTNGYLEVRLQGFRRENMEDSLDFVRKENRVGGLRF